MGKRSTDQDNENVIVAASQYDVNDCAKLLVCTANAVEDQMLTKEEVIIKSVFDGKPIA